MPTPIYRDRVTYRVGEPLQTPPPPGGLYLYQVNAAASPEDLYQVNALAASPVDEFQVSAL